MKQTLKTLCTGLLTLGIFVSLNAQNTREFKSNNNRNSGRSNNYSSRTPAPVRTFNNNDRSITYRSNERNDTRYMPSNNRVTESLRYNPRAGAAERYTSRSSGYRGSSRNIYTDPHHYSNYSYRANNYSYGRHYGNVYGRHTVFMYGPRYRVIPSTFVSIHFGGHPYYYHGGYFYGYHSGYYQPLFPPFGIRIGILPVGYIRFFVGLTPFYYYNGIYYRQFEDNSYEVVDAPMGATVTSLPEGARSVIINGEKLYELNGTYYKADRDSNGNDIFTVVGKNGVINNSSEPGNDVNNALPLQIGDVIDQLPEGSKIVTINGEQLYETPDNIYLKAQTNNGAAEYKVVGK